RRLTRFSRDWSSDVCSSDLVHQGEATRRRPMRVMVLGCGTSSGVPMIGCTCPVCTSGEPRNQRRRCAILIEHAGTTVLVDTPPVERKSVALGKRVDIGGGVL